MQKGKKLPYPFMPFELQTTKMDETEIESLHVKSEWGYRGLGSKIISQSVLPYGNKIRRNCSFSKC